MPLPPPGVGNGLFDLAAGMRHQAVQGLFVELIAGDAERARPRRTRRVSPRQAKRIQLGDGGDAPVMRAEHLREKGPNGRRRGVNPRGIENLACRAKGLSDSLFGQQRGKIQRIARADGAQPRAQGIEHAKGPPCLRVEWYPPGESQDRPLRVDPNSPQHVTRIKCHSCLTYETCCSQQIDAAIHDKAGTHHQAAGDDAKFQSLDSGVSRHFFRRDFRVALEIATFAPKLYSCFCPPKCPS